MTNDKTKNKPKWYQGGQWKELEQGDLLPACPILTPPENLSQILATAEAGKSVEIQSSIGYANLIVTTQTCDLQNEGKGETVLLCAYTDASKYTRNQQIDVSKGKRVAQYMLDRCDLSGLKFEHQIVDFRAVYSLPIPFVLEFAKNLGRRVRVRSPYKENFSKAFGDYFSRVALPRNISELPKEVVPK
ncbi:MAG: hypothetical protein IPI64_05360 [Chloracidobacterium sp.]|nr:hypothetical protein [Chloracidobacterium sp.]